MNKYEEIAMRMINAAKENDGFLNRFPMDEEYEVLNKDEKLIVGKILEKHGKVEYHSLGEIKSLTLKK